MSSTNVYVCQFFLSSNILYLVDVAFYSLPNLQPLIQTSVKVCPFYQPCPRAPSQPVQNSLPDKKKSVGFLCANALTVGQQGISEHL